MVNYDILVIMPSNEMIMLLFTSKHVTHYDILLYCITVGYANQTLFKTCICSSLRVIPTLDSMTS